MNSTRCVFWDFTLRDGIGDWSEDGCEFMGFTNGRVVCQCYHLTNFASIAVSRSSLKFIVVLFQIIKFSLL